MGVRQLVGVLVIAGAYGLTWYFLIRSMRIVRIIDREGLKHAGEIKARLKGKRSSGQSGSHGERTAPNGHNGSSPRGGRNQP